MKIYKINNFVTFKIIKLIDSESKFLGIFKLDDCLNRLRKFDLDLIEINIKDGISICKFSNYKKFIYFENKKFRKLEKLKKKRNKIKEIKFRLFTFTNDYNNKVRLVKNFLFKNLKVKITLSMKGREVLKKNIIKKRVDDLIFEISKFGFLVNKPNYLSKLIFLYFNPKNAKK